MDVHRSWVVLAWQRGAPHVVGESCAGGTRIPKLSGDIVRPAREVCGSGAERGRTDGQGTPEERKEGEHGLLTIIISKNGSAVSSERLH